MIPFIAFRPWLLLLLLTTYYLPNGEEGREEKRRNDFSAVEEAYDKAGVASVFFLNDSSDFGFDIFSAGRFPCCEEFLFAELKGVQEQIDDSFVAPSI